MGLFTAFVIAAAIIIAGTVAYFWLRMDNNSKNLQADFVALQAVKSGLAGQERETITAEGIQLRESLQFAAEDDKYEGIALEIKSAAAARANKQVAIDLADAHFSGDLLNNSTAKVLRAVLREADEYESAQQSAMPAQTAASDEARAEPVSAETGAATTTAGDNASAAQILTPTERKLIESALRVSGESQFEKLQLKLEQLAQREGAVPTSGRTGLNSAENQALIADLISLTEDSDEHIEGLGYAGLTMLYQRHALDGSNEWDGLCEKVYEYSKFAEAADFEAAHLKLYRGECLRKAGRPVEAHDAFEAAREIMDRPVSSKDVFNPGVIPHYRQLLHHGLGTTQLAIIAAQGDEAGKISEELYTQLGEAEEQLSTAARIRELRGATDMGIAYSTENIGFIDLYRGIWEFDQANNRHWQVALDHTDDVGVTIAWNLAIRYSAAKMQEKMLRMNAQSDPEDIAKMQDIQEETGRTFQHWPCASIDMPELLKLLPDAFHRDIKRLKPECVN